MDVNITIEAVLEEELYTVPALMPVLVAKVTGTKQDIPRIFQLTKDLVSQADLKHLRRIKDLDDGSMKCIICKIDPDEKETAIIQNIESRFAKEDLFEGYHCVRVPSRAPKTEHQWRACSKIWPCKYAKSNYLIECIKGTVFQPAERIVLKTIVKNLVKCLSDGNRYQSGAVIFRYAKVFGCGLTCNEDIQCNPIRHSPMIAFDSVAKEAGSGHWVHTETESKKLIDLIRNELGDYEVDLKDHQMEPGFLPYLCTNYDIVVTEEPCMMCTMGLVQSRIRRLFYIDLKSLNSIMSANRTCYDDGAIERFLVHRDKNLNHRFEAWRIKLEEVPS